MKQGDLVIALTTFYEQQTPHGISKSVNEDEILTVRAVSHGGLAFEEKFNPRNENNVEYQYMANYFRKLDIPTNYIEEQIEECLTRELILITKN